MRRLALALALTTLAAGNALADGIRAYIERSRDQAAVALSDQAYRELKEHGLV